jgi:hypothetical protein
MCDLIWKNTKTILHLKSYNLTLYAVSFFEKVSTYYLNSLSKDLMIGFQFHFLKFSICPICTRNGSFEVFFCKPLSRNFLDKKGMAN